MKMKSFQDSPWYSEYEFDSLAEFKQWESGFGTYGTTSPINDMVFRGVGKANEYKLIPSAFRDTKLYYLHDCDTKRLAILNYHQSQDVLVGDYKPSDLAVVSAELSELFCFYKEANLQGLNVPDVEYFRENLFTKYHEQYLEGLGIWPDPKMLELMALAQHYGLPTRLLDWTYNINVALYFALQNVVRRIYDSKNAVIEEPFCVWGVRPNYIQGIFEDFHGADCPVKFYVPIYANNPNLQAQEGLLSYQSISLSEDSCSSVFQAKPVDEILKCYYSHIQSEIANIRYDGVMLCKMIFKSAQPVSEFEYITKHGYNPARLFPGYNGVVKKIEEDEMIRALKHNHIY